MTVNRGIVSDMGNTRKRGNGDARLWLELAVIVTLKLTLLGVIWYIWFSDPLATHMRVGAENVQQQFFGFKDESNVHASGSSR